MKVYKTQAEVEQDIKDGLLTIEGNVCFECSISIEASIVVSDGDINAGSINAKHITAKDITARDINAWDINAGDINAGNINAGSITAKDITAKDITAWDINAKDITAWDINAGNINAWDISYYAFCCAYRSIECISIKARRENSHPPVCLDGKIEYKTEQPPLIGSDIEVKVNGKVYKAKIVG